MGASQVRLATSAVLLAAGAAQAADLVTFLRLIPEHGPQAEANPLVRLATTDLGLLPLVAAKVAPALADAGLAAALALRSRRPVRPHTAFRPAGERSAHGLGTK